jgi:hypothetical protein
MPQYFLPVDPAFTERRRRVQLLTEFGVQPPPAWTDLSKRLDDFLALNDTAVTRLCDAIVTPPGKNPPDVAALRAMALAEQAGPQTVATINNTVVARVQAAMIASYEPVSAANYATIASQFDVIAAEFTAAAETVDPETPSTEMVLAPDDHRTAWSDAERHAHRLDQTLIALVAAAQLAGTRLDNANPELGELWHDANLDEAAVLALAIDTTDPALVRRDVWRAWQTATEGRCRRWSALHKLGVTIRAAALDGFESYREPAPLQYRQEQIPGQPRGIVRTVEIDVDAPGYVARIDPVRA